MSWFSMLVDKYWKATLKSAILSGLDEAGKKLGAGGRDGISVAKDFIAGPDGVIQSQRRVPGELRRAACTLVRGVESEDLTRWLTVARMRVKAW